MLNLLGGMTVPEQGSIVVDGIDLVGLKQAARDSFRANRVGFIFQMFNLIPYLSLIDIVMLPCRFSTCRAEAACKKSGSVEADARRLLDHMEIDLEALENRAVTALSTGQQQRVAAARSLIGAPSLVIADEPTSALDQNVRDAFMSLLFSEITDAGATLLFVSHDVTLASKFDRQTTMSDINNAGTQQ